MLLEKGADQHLKTEIGENALWWSARNGHIVVVQTLLDRGTNPNNKKDLGDGSSPLMQAVLGGHIEIVKLLLSHQADPNAHDLLGKSVLKLAKEKENSGMIEILQKAGAKE